MRGPISFPSWLVALLVLNGCADERPSLDETCTLGQTRECPCEDAEPGTQSCLFESPASWSYCACNMAPVADTGDDFWVVVHTTAQLDGTGSYDPDSSVVEYDWELVEVPAGSTAVLDDGAAARPTFDPDVQGAYVARLIVGDGETWSTPALVTVSAVMRENAAPTADAGHDAFSSTGQPHVLDGSGSADPDGDPLSYTWMITTRPVGSTAALANPTTVTPTLTPDVDGTYELTLVVSDGALSSTPETVTITSRSQALPLALPYRPIDAEYSRALDRIILVAAAPDTLYIYDPATRTSTAVALPTAPTSVSVSPNGLQAAVGHDGWVSIIDLPSATLTVTHPVSTRSVDVVLAGNGYVYVFPAVDQHERIRSVHLATGTETLHTGSQIYAGTRAKLHPSGSAIYGAVNDLSPADIEKYSISNGSAVYGYDSPYHGHYPMCGDLWMSEDGLRIITRCGNVFHASEDRSEDMTYDGSLSGLPRIRHAVHASTAEKILAIPSAPPFGGTGLEDRVLRIYSYAQLGFEQQITLPPFTVLTNQFASHGRFVFSNSTGTEYYVVVQADSTSRLVNDHAVVTFAF